MMDRQTGKPMEELAHIRQSLADIIFTPIGSRIGNFRRSYGSELPRLIDQPINDVTILRLISATVMAILQWENRIRLTRVTLSEPTMKGALTLEISAVRTDDNQPVSFSYPLQRRT